MAVTLYFLSDTKIEAHASALLFICGWKSARHLNLNLDKKGLFFPRLENPALYKTFLSQATSLFPSLPKPQHKNMLSG